MSIKPDLLELDTSRTELIEKSGNPSSINVEVYYYYNYFDKILFFNNPNINESFLKEFVDDYINSLNKYEVFGTEPEFTNNLLLQLKKLVQLPVIIEDTDALNNSLTRIEKQYNNLLLSLAGKSSEDGFLNKAFFPLIDQEQPALLFGVIDSITVRIKRTTDGDKFLIVPSEKEIEKKIIEQCKNSWQLAIRTIKKYVKRPYKYHEVIVSFDKKIGIYEGNSLGIALTISFIEEVLKLYNPVYEISIKEKTAFTGGVTDSGKVLNIGETIIRQKISTVFFSNLKSFVIPKSDETAAIIELNKLQEKYPERKLKLISVEEIDDILNRRDIIEIKKRNSILRTGRFIKKNWISAAIVILLTMLFTYLFAIDFDDNPYSATFDGNKIYIKNKRGRILWDKPYTTDRIELNSALYRESLVKIVDIDDDSKNEVIINQLPKNLNHQSYPDRVACFSSTGEVKWIYVLRDTVYSKREKLLPPYGIYIIDTLTFNGIKSLYLSGSNEESFSSVIFRIDLKTGKRLPGTLWSSGHSYNGIIKDINGDGKKDLVYIGLDNGYEDAILFGFKLDTLTSVRLSTDEYLINGFPIESPIAYIRFPKTDYDIYEHLRTPAPINGSFYYEEITKTYKFYTLDIFDKYSHSLWYLIKDNFRDIDVTIDNRFRIMRDSLVANGKLPLPYTDTKEYKELIKNNILYWQDDKWVHKQDLK